MAMMTPNPLTQDHQRGSTLIVALVMLLLISLIAVGSMQDTILQERMTSNTEDRMIAFEGAEAALREGEGDLADGAWGDDRINPLDDWSTLSDINSIPVVDNRAAGQPQYHLGPGRCPQLAEGGCAVEMFDVSARGVGGRAGTTVILRSTFGRAN